MLRTLFALPRSAGPLLAISRGPSSAPSETWSWSTPIPPRTWVRPKHSGEYGYKEMSEIGPSSCRNHPARANERPRFWIVFLSQI
jgi:hypothetical protein